MAIEVQQVEVGFIPVIESFDAKKVYATGPTEFNAIVLDVFNQLNVFAGAIDGYSEVGAYESLISVSFSDRVFSHIEDIQENFREFSKHEVDIKIERREGASEWTIQVKIDNIPNMTFLSDLVQSNQSVKIVNPRIVGDGEEL